MFLCLVALWLFIQLSTFSGMSSTQEQLARIESVINSYVAARSMIEGGNIDDEMFRSATARRLAHAAYSFACDANRYAELALEHLYQLRDAIKGEMKLADVKIHKDALEHVEDIEGENDSADEKEWEKERAAQQ